MGVKISAATPAVSVAGTELVPVSQSGTPRSVTVDQVKDYAIDQIEAIAAGTTAPLTDKVFILQGGDIKPVDLSVVAKSVIDSVWAKADQATPADANKLALKDGSTEKTVTLTGLAAYVQTAIRAAVLNPATLDAAGATADADLFVIGQAGAAKKITLATVNAAIYAGLSAHVSAQTASSGAADTDVFYTVTGVGVRKTTLAQIKTAIGVGAGIIGPATTTGDYVPQWNGSKGAGDAKEFKNGLLVRSVVRGHGSTDGALATETAIRVAIHAIDREVVSEVSPAESASGSKLASEEAIRNAIDAAPGLVAPDGNKEEVVETDSVIVLDSQDSDAPKKTLLENIRDFMIATNLALGETESTAYRGDRGSVAYTHSQSAHAPSSAQKNSYITKTEIEEKLIGLIDSHTHVGLDGLVYKGVFANVDALNGEVPVGQPGWYASNLDTGTIWYWNEDAAPDPAWENSLVGPALELGETESTAHRGDHGKAAYDHSQIAHAPANAQTAVAGINLQTGTTYTLTLADAGKLVRCSNAADVVVTIPPNATIDQNIGAVITIEQAGAGTVTVAGAGGVTTHSNDGEETAGQYAAMQIIQITTDEWVVYGGVTNV